VDEAQDQPENGNVSPKHRTHNDKCRHQPHQLRCTETKQQAGLSDQITEHGNHDSQRTSACNVVLPVQPSYSSNTQIMRMVPLPAMRHRDQGRLQGSYTTIKDHTMPGAKKQVQKKRGRGLPKRTGKHKSKYTTYFEHALSRKVNAAIRRMRASKARVPKYYCICRKASAMAIHGGCLRRYENRYQGSYQRRNK
jgi:hypothetical protein